MELLLGTYEHAIDDKSRLTVPSKLRGKIGNTVYLSKGFDGCLELRTQESFLKWTQDIMKFKNTDSRARVFNRAIFSNSIEAEIDSAGRIKIPANLMELANLKKDVYIIGVGDKLEIWDTNEFDRYQNEQEESFEEVAQKLGAGINE